MLQTKMMNVKELTTAQLLMEKSHAEQVGTPWDVYLLEINEELEARKGTSEPSKEEEAPVTLERPKAKGVRFGEVYKHVSYQKVISDYGYANYVPKEWNGLYKMDIELLQAYPNSVATVVFDKNNHIQKISCSGKGSRGFTQAIKNLAKRHFMEYMG